MHCVRLLRLFCLWGLATAIYGICGCGSDSTTAPPAPPASVDLPHRDPINTRLTTEVRVKPLPTIENTLLLRTDFSDDSEWASLCKTVQQPNEDGFQAYLECISDSAYEGLTVEQIIVLEPKGDQGGKHIFAFIADQTTFASPERPVLVVDLDDEPGRTFRVIPRKMWSVENNLSIGNMDYSEFAENVDPDGIFRGFP